MKTVLVIDDDPLVRQSLVDYFEDQSWQVLEAETAELALELLQHHALNAVIVDVRLPGQSGTDFVRATAEHYPKTAFVMCTGSPDYSLQDDLLANVNVSSSVYQKPVTDMAALEKEIAAIIDAIS